MMECTSPPVSSGVFSSTPLPSVNFSSTLRTRPPFRKKNNISITFTEAGYETGGAGGIFRQPLPFSYFFIPTRRKKDRVRVFASAASVNRTSYLSNYPQSEKWTWQPEGYGGLRFHLRRVAAWIQGKMIVNVWWGGAGRIGCDIRAFLAILRVYGDLLRLRLFWAYSGKMAKC